MASGEQSESRVYLKRVAVQAKNIEMNSEQLIQSQMKSEDKASNM